MTEFMLTVLTQCLTFFPLALGISISYHILRATDMTLDGSFVLGAAIFAVMISANYSPYYAFGFALLGGATAGLLVATIQRNGKVDPLLAGVLATFILSSVNLMVMGKPNINLLNFSLTNNEFESKLYLSIIVLLIAGVTLIIFKTSLGLHLRALGDNPKLFQRLGKNTEIYRLLGFALTNMLAASSGCLTAEAIGYADIGMGFGMTLTGIGAIILGQQIIKKIRAEEQRIVGEIIACLIGVLIYFFALNALLQFDLDPLYLKLFLGLILIFFLRSAQIKREEIA